MRYKKKYFVYVLIFTLIYYIGLNNKQLIENISKFKKCLVIHIGVVCTGYNNNVHLYMLLKSIYYIRTSPLHFHVIVDKESEKTVRILFETWAVQQVRVSYYNTNGTHFDWLSEKHNSGLLNFAFPKLVPVNITNKIIVLGPDVIFAANLNKLWNLFDDFKDQQFIGIPRINFNTTNINKLESNLILFYLDHIQEADWNQLWTSIVDEYKVRSEEIKTPNQDFLNKFMNYLFVIPCNWNVQERIIVMNNRDKDCHQAIETESIHSYSQFMDINKFMEYDGNLLPKQVDGCFENENNIKSVKPSEACLNYPESQRNKRRTVLFFRKFNYTPTEHDVTLVTQLSYNKLDVLDQVVRRWQGPMSLSFYVTDSELQKCINFIENSTMLQNRTNIAYHAILKEGQHHPINALRNTALNQVVTPYVFLNDMDLVPMVDIYFNIKKYISEIKSMNKKALIVPAFETRNSKTVIPATKQELLKMLDGRSIWIMLSRGRIQGHQRTNFTRWRSAQAPYEVKWEPKFEPYVVVEKNVTQYDERFFGYGWNKIAHIAELEAQGYAFFVLPTAFSVHKYHRSGTDKNEFRVSNTYKMCLQSLKQDWAQDLWKKYGRKFEV